MPSIKERLNLDTDPVFLIDGTALFYRAFYSRADLTRSDGFPTGAVNTTLRVLMNLMRDEQPAHLAFIMDGKGPTFRHEMYEPYKAQRPAMPEPLVMQIEPVRQAIELLGVKLMVSDGVEADDCIASLAARYKAEHPVVIVAADKDLKQCLDTNVVLLNQARKDKLTTLEEFQEEEGMTPAQWPDFQALIGDSADNIPGIPKVGPVTAKKIMAEFPTLESLRDGYENLPAKLRAKVEPELENIFLYRELTRMKLDCCTNPLSELEVHAPDRDALLAFFEEYELRSLSRAIPKTRAAVRMPVSTPAAKPSAPGTATQGLLFDMGETRPKADPIRLTEITTASALPDMTGKDVGLCAEDTKFRLGVEDREYLYTGDTADLAKSLSKTARIATPSVQDLLRADTAWEALRPDQWFDLSLAAYLLDPEARNYAWDRLRQSLYQNPGPGFAEVAQGLHPEAQGLAALAYMRGVIHSVENANLLPLMRDLEQPLIPVLVGMERQGIGVDANAFRQFLEEVSHELESLTRKIIDQSGGEPFNIRSSQQLATVLFDRLELKPSGKTPGGQLSTANQVLEKLRSQHPIIEDILEYRMLEKLRSTYLEPLPKLMDKSGRIHTHFNQLATATGRLSSSGPNLQNIPIRGKHGPRMRACFTAGPGNLIAAADYSQVELRVLAHFSRDPNLLDAFRNDQDIHARTAALLHDKDAPEAVTPDERRSAKTINFGLIYGMGPQKLARELKITVNQAKEFIARYFEKLDTLKKFYDSVVEEAQHNGFVTTLAGRRRLLPELHSRNSQVVSQARRQAINTVIQGSAADIIKMAMLKAHNDNQLAELDARLILQVHDELLIEAPKDTIEAAGKRLMEVMQTTAELDVPLKVDMGIGFTWAEAH
ncbi:DNA polymerase I [Pseudodesulfovibrio tunisiensis]|uniref:DNA polymerase I n=1 Tax=Pseudodesulfovibrio tunisiensis TaxID=463192 RepID=UPI001FB48981|nr:DNA polymerase I [Pseudodesulfovibrio tunisiensis]